MRTFTRPRRRPASVAGPRPTALTALTAAALLTGCSFEDSICSDGEYPVMTVGATGSACVPNDEQPPKGYVRYPEGKVPKHVDDKWDMYWRTHTLDTNGKIITVSEPD
ncbi:SCO0607 family lipoprotein [Streptomyces sp. MMS24-I29]|uniref:SCO0607 family lipoprotein n=1 Tax=Streptomyces sp. MMS24-I29 TaxID=3351480 RepID=UPI003C7DA2EA